MQQNQASAGESVIGYEEKITTQGTRVPTCGVEHKPDMRTQTPQ